MYKRGLIALKQQKMSDQKKIDIGRTGVVVCLFSRGWGGVGRRSLVLVVAYY